MRILILDTETNGLGQNNHVLQLAYLVISQRVVRDKGNVFFKRDLIWNEMAYNVHQIPYEFLSVNGVDPTDFYVNKFVPLLSTIDLVVGHNICSFDKKVILDDFERLDIKYTPSSFPKIFDTLEWARLAYGKNAGNKLAQVFERMFPTKSFNSLFKAHDAFDDVRATAWIFDRIMHKNPSLCSELGFNNVLYSASRP